MSLTFSGLSNGANGGKASNYTIGGLLTNGSPATSGTATTTANITPKTLTASFTGTNETYNGTTTDAVSYVSLNGVIGTDIVSLSTTPTTGAFSDANAGTGKTVTISGLSLTGTRQLHDSHHYDHHGLDYTPCPATERGPGTRRKHDGPPARVFPSNAVAGIRSVQRLCHHRLGSDRERGDYQRERPQGQYPNYTLTGATGTVAVTSADQVVSQVASGTVLLGEHPDG